MSKSMRFQIDVEPTSIEVLNPQFSKAKAYVMYAGVNRNNSYMSKETIVNSLKTIQNIPVVGEWREANENFGGHGGRIVIEDSEIKFVETTKPYGVVPESCNPRWEMVKDRYSGEEKEYLVVDIYLWSGRYPELNKVVESGSWQSMEIEPTDAEWVTHQDEQGFMTDVYKINDFNFSALCILAKDEDPDVDVEPCFEDAQIVAYSLDKDAFKKEFTEMLNELKYSLDNQGGDGVEGVNLTPETEAEETQTEENFEEAETTETAEEEVKENETAEEEAKADDFEDSSQEEEEGAEEAETAEEEPEAEEFEEGESEEEDTPDVEESEEDEAEADEAVDYQATIEKLESRVAELEGELNAYKLKEKEEALNELFANFADMLDEEDIEPIKAKAVDMDIEDVEKELSYAFVKKTKNFSANKTSTRVSVAHTDASEDDAPYGTASKYFIK